MPAKLEPRGHPPIEITADVLERILLSGAYGHYLLRIVFKGGVPPVELQIDERSYAQLVLSVTAVRTLIE